MSDLPELPELAARQRIDGVPRIALASALKQHYEAGASVRDLAAGMGRSYGWVMNLLKESDTSLRRRGRRPAIRKAA